LRYRRFRGEAPAPQIILDLRQHLSQGHAVISQNRLTAMLIGAVRCPVPRVLGILLDEATGRILVQDAGQQGLIRNPLLESPLLQGLEILA
jgi:hypothetical protein